ncbi:MAG: MFS transporter, partial [Bdellovibrionota bacterium]
IGNLLAATQDIATDGLAVDLTTHEERGWVNSIQVAGYRIGMILGGGALLALFPSIGWSGVMIAIAVLCLACTVPVLRYREPLERKLRPEVRGIRETLMEVLHFLRRPGALLWAAVLLTYKLGHASATAMMKPWLVDVGYSPEQIAGILGSAGLVAGFLGAVTGGLLAAKFERRRLLIALTVLQALAVSSYLWPLMTERDTMKVLVATGFDHFTSGLATVTLFTLMMDACSKERAAADYTMQACLVVVSQISAGAISLILAEKFGYSQQFAVAALAGLGGLCLTTFALTRDRSLEFFQPTLKAASIAIIFAVTATGVAHAQTPEGAPVGPANSYLFHLHGDTFLPSRISGATEIVPGWGAGVSIPTGKGLFMIDSFVGKGSGSEYKSIIGDLRLDVANDVIPVQFLLGFHADTWTPINGESAKFSGGWHFGGGIMFPLAGPFFLESDFRYRFSPGTSLLIGVGLTYVLNSGSGG